MPTLNNLGKNASSIMVILSLFAVVGAYAGGLIPTYALASELDDHIKDSDMRIRLEIEDKILITEDSLQVYEAMKAQAPLTAIDRLKESQLINRKARHLRQLGGVNSRSRL